jgi:HSP20 family protein
MEETMGLIPWRNKQEVPVRKEGQEQWSSLAQLRAEVDRIFDNVFTDSWSVFSKGGLMKSISSWVPSIDAAEDEKQVLVALEVPGIDVKDIDISVSGNALVVRGEKTEEKEDKGKNYYLSERRFGSFQRSIELPSNVDADSIAAEYKNGVLRITAKKTGDFERKQIPIQT